MFFFPIMNPSKRNNTRKYEMQGSHRDMMEKFAGKQKDNSKRSENKASRQNRDQRRNRHPDAE